MVSASNCNEFRVILKGVLAVNALSFRMIFFQIGDFRRYFSGSFTDSSTALKAAKWMTPSIFPSFLNTESTSFLLQQSILYHFISPPINLDIPSMFLMEELQKKHFQNGNL